MEKHVKAKPRLWSELQYNEAMEFHGHGGPYMVVGLRMGYIALKELESVGWFDISCKAKLRLTPPDSCVIDGLQCSTGCTLGKGNISVEEGEGVSATFTSRMRTVKIKLRENIVREISSALDGISQRKCGTDDPLVVRLFGMKDNELFEID